MKLKEAIQTGGLSYETETLTALLQLQCKEPCNKFKPTQQMLTLYRNAVGSLNADSS